MPKKPTNQPNNHTTSQRNSPVLSLWEMTEQFSWNRTMTKLKHMQKNK